MLYLTRENRKKAETRKNTTRMAETPGLGDKSAWFVYST